MTHFRISLFFILSLFLSWSIVACRDKAVAVPKPHAYPKITFPERAYLVFDTASCPFRFEYPVYSRPIKNTEFMGEPVPNDCWYDIFIPHFNAKLHLTYYPFHSKDRYDELIQDAYRLTNEHTQKANFIDEVPIEKKGVFTGKLFDLTGPSATPLEFYLTDEKQHFIRGALYLHTEVHPDSLKPIYDFLKADVVHLIQSFSWK